MVNDVYIYNVIPLDRSSRPFICHSVKEVCEKTEQTTNAVNKSMELGVSAGSFLVRRFRSPKKRVMIIRRNEVKEFDDMDEACRYFGLRKSTLQKKIADGTPIRNGWCIDYID